MYEITTPREAPYASVCYIRAIWANGTATRASGVVVGVNDVLTALHAVYDTGRGGWATHIDIYPGTDTSPYFTAPYGDFMNVGSIVGHASNWDLDGDGLLTPQESQGDLALIGLKQEIGESTGWLPVTQLPADFTGTLVGYPAGGTGMMAEVDPVHASTAYSVYTVSSGLGAGASGGPLLYTAGGVTSVVGVLSSGNSLDTFSTYAGLFGTGTWDWLRGALDANDPLVGLPPGRAPQASPNIYTGTAGGDFIVGSAGRDVFTGLAGNDVFDGSDGTDTAVYAGSYSSHAVTLVSPTEIDVADQLASRDGSDVLRHVERVRFDDYSVAFDVNGAAGEAYRLYQAALDRQPDLGGLGYQMNALDSGLTLSEVAGNFIASAEFASTYSTNLTNEQFVAQLYANVLKRAPDDAGLQYHLNDLAAGLTRADVLTHFSESPENQALVIGSIQGGMLYIA